MKLYEEEFARLASQINDKMYNSCIYAIESLRTALHPTKDDTALIRAIEVIVKSIEKKFPPTEMPLRRRNR